MENKKILLVEDDPNFGNILRDYLSLNDFEVTLAKDGLEGFVMFKNNDYDLCILDVMMPRKDGFTLAKDIRKQNTQIPIIFLTAKDTVQDTILGLRSGANDYLKKPFSFEELLERIRVHFRKSQHQTTVFQHGPLTIDNTKREVKWHDTLVSLTQKEHDLLLFLVKNKNKVCTRKEILQKVWDIHFEYNSGVIDVYINSLRKKFPFEVPENFIETIRGIGYIIKDKT